MNPRDASTPPTKPPLRDDVQQLHPLAGQPAPRDALIDVDKVLGDYYTRRPDVADPAQRVKFGTSGHRGSSLRGSFNEAHVLAIAQAICEHRKSEDITGPLYIGKDTHALSEPAFRTALEVLAANAVETMVDRDGGYTPTPAVSRAILEHNRGRNGGRADGIVITPSRNPPEDGGLKYVHPHGGPADIRVTSWIEDRANELLAGSLQGVPRVTYERARRAGTAHVYDYLGTYTGAVVSAVDMDALRDARIKIGVDPMGGAAIAYWSSIADRYGLQLELVDDTVDPRFGFMCLDWDGKIRTDCSSPYAMARLIGFKDRYDIAVGNDADGDRHGIVSAHAGLMRPNHYLAASIWYLFTHRTEWRSDAAVGKTVVCSSLIDRVSALIGRRLLEVPVGFKWFVPGLLAGTLGFAGEESAGAAFLRRDGSTWTTEKDGIVMGLLAAEIMARIGQDPAQLYEELTRELGAPLYERLDSPATSEQKARLLKLSPAELHMSSLAGDQVHEVLTSAPGNGEPIGGLKVVTANGWFAIRPSGTEEICKLYAESFLGVEHLQRIQSEAQSLISRTLA